MNEEIMRRYRHPAFQADIDKFCLDHKKTGSLIITSSGENTICGDSLRIALCITDGKITDACYDGFGCSLCIASAECSLEMITGHNITILSDLSPDRILTALGNCKVGLSRMKCVELSLDVLKNMAA